MEEPSEMVLFIMWCVLGKKHVNLAYLFGDAFPESVQMTYEVEIAVLILSSPLC